MKKILMLTAFALASLAAAQTDTTTPPATTTPDTAAPATDTTTPVAAPATTTPATMTPAMTAMSPADSYAKAQEYATQAELAYPLPFYDRALWKASVDAAYVASAGDASNRDYTAYLGQLYTKTQWWINAYNVWAKIGTLTDTEKDWAALSAAKLAYIALGHGDKATAQTYVTQGMAWKNTPSLMSIQAALQ